MLDGSSSPDLTFTYTDRKVHDDIYAVLKFSSREMMASEHAERVMKMWRDFVEPFFGIKRNNPEGDYLDDSAEQAALLVHKDDDEDIDSFESDGDAGEAKDGHLPDMAIEPLMSMLKIKKWQQKRHTRNDVTEDAGNLGMEHFHQKRQLVNRMLRKVKQL